MKKIAAIVVIAALTGGIGYFFIHSKTQQSKSSIKPSPEVSKVIKTKQMQVAEAYFDSFSACMKQPPEDAAGQVQDYCQSHNKYAGKDLVQVACGQNPPKSVAAKRTTEINENQALVIVTYNFSAETKDVMYQMQREEEEWKVEKIICPK